MAAINTNFNVSCDTDPNAELLGHFEIGEDPKYLTMTVRGTEGEIDLSKTDAVELIKWLESTILLMDD